MHKTYALAGVSQTILRYLKKTRQMDSNKTPFKKLSNSRHTLCSMSSKSGFDSPNQSAKRQIFEIEDCKTGGKLKISTQIGHTESLLDLKIGALSVLKTSCSSDLQNASVGVSQLHRLDQDYWI